MIGLFKNRKLVHQKHPGMLVISLDFELLWGVHDVFDKHTYSTNIRGVHRVIPALLELFKTFHIHATWAIVGLLYFKDEQDLKENIPKTIPLYKNKQLSPYHYLEKNRLMNSDDPLFFAPDLFEQIRTTPGQEIASHTFSHYYCLEEGQTEDQFIADLKQFKKINQQRGIIVKSIVFPRNQINVSYLDICQQFGFSAYRGNEKSWVYRLQKNDRKHFLKRGLRLIDTYFNIFGHQCYPIQQIDRTIPVNIPSSRMLKPVSTTLKGLERRRLTRILDDMTHAAKCGEIYHLWWHPHNFGANIEENLSFLQNILVHYEQLQATYGFENRNMEEVATAVMQVPAEKVR